MFIIISVLIKRQIEVFNSVCFIAVCEILHSREKKSTSVLKIPRIKVKDRVSGEVHIACLICVNSSEYF